jgi:hypothetical protein
MGVREWAGVGSSLAVVGWRGYWSRDCRRLAVRLDLIVAVTIAIVIVLVVDLDQPARGFITVPTGPLLDVAKEIQQ